MGVCGPNTLKSMLDGYPSALDYHPIVLLRDLFGIKTKPCMITDLENPEEPVQTVNTWWNKQRQPWDWSCSSLHVTQD